MSREKPPSGTDSGAPFLSRWSRRKIDARKGEVPAQEPKRADPPVAREVAAPAGTAPTAPPTLPPVESLTPESDFAPFMGEGVDASIRRSALRTLFQDPRFNVMDGLDVYIDDYSKPDPLPEGWLEKMNQVARLGEYHAPDEEPPEGEAPVAEAGETGAAPAVAEVESAPAEPARPLDTATPESPSPTVPESPGKPPRNPGHMV